MIKLVGPSVEYKDSYIQAVEEFQAEGREVDLVLTELKSNLGRHVSQLLDEAKGVGLQGGFVPATTFWLVEDKEYIGTVSIRHQLNEALLKVGGHIGYRIRPSKRKMGYGKKILELSLPKAKELGIKKALLTCDETNIGSRKIIESNGGVLENSVSQGEGKPNKFRYWIAIK